MKKILLILIILIPNSLIGQNKELDKKVFDYVNTYRIQNGVDTLIWDDNVYKMSNNQNDYILENKILTHSQDNPKLKNVTERRKHFLGDSYVKANEIALIDRMTFLFSNDSLKFLSSEVVNKVEFIEKLSGKEIRNIESEDLLILSSIYIWSTSPSHNEILLKDFKYGAVSYKILKLNKKEKTVLFKGMGMISGEAYSVMNFAK